MTNKIREFKSCRSGPSIDEDISRFRRPSGINITINKTEGKIPQNDPGLATIAIVSIRTISLKVKDEGSIKLR